MKTQAHFIVGMPRAGTTWLAKCLNKHSQVAVFGESCYFGRNAIDKPAYDKADLDLLSQKMEDSINNLATDYEGGIYNRIREAIQQAPIPSDQKTIFDTMLESVANATDKNIIVEKTPHHIDQIAKISSLYPDAKFVVMSRDPKGFMLSNKHVHEIKPKEIQANIKGMYHPLISMLNYGRYQKSIQAAMKRDNTMLVNIKEIGTKPTEILTNIQQFFNIKNEDITIPKFHSTQKKGVKRELSLEDKVWYNLLGNEKDEKLNAIEWLQSPFVLLFSLLKMPIWFFWAYKNINKSGTVNPITYLLNLAFKRS